MNATVKRTHATQEVLRRQAADGQMAFMEALTQAAPWRSEQLAFHGGTSLHLSWNSPRFSEDLDFLLNKDFASKMDKVLKAVERRVRQMLKAKDPGLMVEFRNKTKEGSNLLHYQMVISNPGRFLGSSMVKVEFWKVDADYLRQYQTEFVFPAKPNDIISRVTHPVPAATLEAAYADKLTAFATRPFLKWRDVFDLWWLGRQVSVTPEEIAPRFLKHVRAYHTVDDLPPAQAIRRLLGTSKVDVVKQADPDLRKWLPEMMWRAVNPEGVTQMVDYVYYTLDQVSLATEKLQGALVPPCFPKEEAPHD